MSLIPNIYFHSVAFKRDPLWINSFLTLELKYFEDLVSYLTKSGYRFLFLDEYFAIRQKGINANFRMICLTFDDGYLDNYVFAYPILKKYRAKATIFVSPDYVQQNKHLRPTLEDVWRGDVSSEDLLNRGFASWDELKTMQDSGVIDIQSHTMTHTKYAVSDKIRDFHHPSADYLYPIINLYPEIKPNYMNITELSSLLPYGTPLYEEKSSVVARIVKINKKFQHECTEILKDSDWQHYSFAECFDKIKSVYHDYKTSKQLITKIETSREYEARVKRELLDSKKIIEKKIGKPVLHCCWPHGEYNQDVHRYAIAMGYASSLIVLKPGEENIYFDRFDRMGSGKVLDNRILTLVKNIYRINAYRSVFPYTIIQTLYQRIKYGKR